MHRSGCEVSRAGADLVRNRLERLDYADGHIEYLVDDAAGGAVSSLKLGIIGIFLLQQLLKRLFGLVLFVDQVQEINAQLFHVLLCV